MISSTIPSGCGRRSYFLGELLQRAEGSDLASWTDITKSSGIYVVQWLLDERPHFQATAALHSHTIDPTFLYQKWQQINKRAPTDIIYIGKGDDLRARVRALVRFGVGKSKNHHGGEWMWQIDQIRTAGLMIQECPTGQQIAFENWLLDRFSEDHGELPLANRSGPRGDQRWCP